MTDAPLLPTCDIKGTTWRDAPGIWNDAQVAGWRSVTEAVHAEGG
jgi:2,4-dienoyl-CoA reductase-like NADH-dependent reductase (Old Yellow Enzyme family)